MQGAAVEVAAEGAAEEEEEGILEEGMLAQGVDAGEGEANGEDGEVEVQPLPRRSLVSSRVFLSLLMVEVEV